MLGVIVIGVVISAIVFILAGIWIGVDDEGLSIPIFMIFMASLILFLTVCASIQYGRDTSVLNVCPECNETYDRDMKYCSADGTELVLSLKD